MARRVYNHNKAHSPLEEAKKQLYLLKTALITESQEKILDRIDKIRALLVAASEDLKE